MSIIQSKHNPADEPSQHNRAAMIKQVNDLRALVERVSLGGDEDGETGGALEHERVALAHLGHLPWVDELDGAALPLVARPELEHIVSEGHLNTQPEREQRFHNMSSQHSLSSNKNTEPNQQPKV